MEDTPAKAAIHEALVNALIHADYSISVSILFEKRVDRIIFRNPGTMRIPLELAAHGGTSDCRNRALPVMFRMGGFGDQAGSGISVSSFGSTMMYCADTMEIEQTVLKILHENTFHPSLLGPPMGTIGVWYGLLKRSSLIFKVEKSFRTIMGGNQAERSKKQEGDLFGENNEIFPDY